MKEKVLMLASVASMIEQFNMHHIRLLQDLGYEVHVACNFYKGNTCSLEKIRKLRETLVHIGVSHYQVNFSRNIWNLAANTKAWGQVRRLLRDNGYAFMHCHSPIGGVIGRIAGKQEGTKVIYTAHGFHFFKGGGLPGWLLYYPAEKLLSFWTDTLITINKEDYELAHKRFSAKSIVYLPGVGIDVEKIRSIPAERDIKRKELEIPADGLLLVSVGELSVRKNHETVIKALDKIKNHKIYYIICGQGQLEKKLSHISTQLHQADRVKLLGYREDVIEIMKAADIFVFPSLQEGLPVALMEAMACGLPVIASNIRGNVDLVVKNKGGYLAEKKAAGEYAAAINDLMKEKEKRLEMGRYNWEQAARYHKTQIENKMKEIYQGFLGSNKS